MDVIVLIGRIMFALLFLFSGIAHLTSTDMMAGYAESKGVPSARIAVRASGLMILVGAVMVILGLWPDLGALLIFLFLVPTAVLMHNFWKETDPAAKMQEQTQFNKDVALAGAALALFAFFAYAGHDLGLTLTGPLFDLS